MKNLPFYLLYDLYQICPKKFPKQVKIFRSIIAKHIFNFLVHFNCEKYTANRVASNPIILYRYLNFIIIDLYGTK